MMVSASLLLIVIIAAAVWGTARTHHGSSAEHAPRAITDPSRWAPPGAPAPTPARGRRSWSDISIDRQLDRWVAAGLMTADQAARIAAHERQLGSSPVAAPMLPPAPPAHPRRIPVVAEALGYIGGMLGIVGLVLLVSRYWADMAVAGRLGLAAGGAVALVGAGWLVHEHADPALARLRWFLWMASSAATGLFAAVVAIDVFELHESRMVCVIATAVALESGLLWWWRERPVQQLTTLVASMVAIGTLFDQVFSTGVTGAALWVVGVVLVLIALRHLTPVPIVTLLVGGGTTAAGAGIASDTWIGPAMLALVVSAAIALALAAMPGMVRPTVERRVLAVMGAIALFQSLPMTIAHFARDAGLATGLTMWVVGGGLLIVGVGHRVRWPMVVEAVGAISMLVGAAVTGVQSQAFATLFGVTTAIVLVAVGMLPGRVLMSVLGSIGLLAFVPWSISHFFPGEGRAPLLILVSGALIVGIAVLLTRQGKRFRRELRAGTESEARRVDVDTEEHPTEGLVETR
jgi:hypothetical protein